MLETFDNDNAMLLAAVQELTANQARLIADVEELKKNEGSGDGVVFHKDYHITEKITSTTPQILEQIPIKLEYGDTDVLTFIVIRENARVTEDTFLYSISSFFDFKHISQVTTPQARGCAFYKVSTQQPSFNTNSTGIYVSNLSLFPNLLDTITVSAKYLANASGEIIGDYKFFVLKNSLPFE